MSFSEMMEMAQMSDLQAIQARAVAYGALDVMPATTARGCEWPADAERVSLERITYSHSDDTFTGWDIGPVPEWVQR